ncbi:MAG TPA: fatty acid desaturase [Patescibacteria group bacterium]|nr:fatty acid desaturase [Patescibacteria group bacterium]
MLTRLELTKFQKRSDLRSAITVLAHLTLVLAPVFLAAFLGVGWWLLPCWLAFGLLMNGLLNLMHECAHYLVFTARAGSDLVGRWLLGPLALADFDGYRERHWKHHTNFGVEGDTKDAYLVDIRGGRLPAFFLRCLALREALRKFRHQTAGKDAGTPCARSPLPWLARSAVFQTLLAALLVLTAHLRQPSTWTDAAFAAVLAYAFVYVYGLASLTVFAATLRAVAEHQLEAGQHCDARRAALRNFKCGPISWLVFGSYGFAEHGTHHCEPGLAYYHLPQATTELAAQDPALAPLRSYLRELAALAVPRAASPGAGS